MKKTLILMASMLISMLSMAQQALWDMKQPETAIVNNDHSVTIRVWAPQAHEILLEGEMTGTVKMERDSMGLWSYTTAPLAADLYLYYLRVDGVRALDPGNTYVARDIASLFNYVLVEDYQSKDIAHGTVQQIWCPQEGFEHGRRMTVYLPAGYDDNRSERYPVLYLLHGSGGDEQAWIELGRAAQILDKEIAAGRAKPMIVVMPNGNYSEDAAPGYGRKGNVRPGVPEEHRMDGVYEEHFGEIVNYIDRHYRTRPDARSRAIAGLSMGGFHTYWIALNNPRMFRYIGPFSAVYHFGNDMSAEVYQNENSKRRALWNTHPFVHIYIGHDDFLYQQNVEVRSELDRSRYEYQYTESEGGHQWKNWRRYLENFVSEIF